MSAPALPEIKPAKHLYFVNKWVDFAIIGGGSIIALGIFWLIQRQYRLPAGGFAPQHQTWVDNCNWMAYMLVWIVNWPHFSATSYRLYHSKQNIAQYPVTALVIPVLIIVAMFGSFMSPLLIAPLFVKLYIIWSPYHFSGQTVGISMIYARRAGFSVGKWERMCLSGFIFGTFICTVTRAEVGYYNRAEGDVLYPTLGLPPEIGKWSEYGLYACGAAFLAFVIAWCIRNKKILPPIVLLPAVTQYVWFLVMVDVPAIYLFVPFFHSLQYMLIAWSMQLKEKMDERGLAPSKQYVLIESLRWGMLNVAGGILLFRIFPLLGEKAGYAAGFSSAVVLAAVQLHHFFVDGVIWKLKNPKVSSPLLVNIEDLVGPPREAEPVKQAA